MRGDGRRASAATGLLDERESAPSWRSDRDDASRDGDISCSHSVAAFFAGRSCNTEWRCWNARGILPPESKKLAQRCAFLCVLDIAGTEKLFGPAATLAEKLKNRVKALGITASVAVSRNFHAAICLARGMSANISTTVIHAGGGKRCSGSASTLGAGAF